MTDGCVQDWSSPSHSWSSTLLCTSLLSIHNNFMYVTAVFKMQEPYVLYWHKSTQDDKSVSRGLLLLWILYSLEYLSFILSIKSLDETLRKQGQIGTRDPPGGWGGGGYYLSYCMLHSKWGEENFMLCRICTSHVRMAVWSTDTLSILEHCKQINRFRHPPSTPPPCSTLTLPM